MIKLSPDQQAATDAFMDFILKNEPGEMAISGPAGTGKSFLTKHLLHVARKSADLIKLLTTDDNQLNVHLTSTTNKASKVLGDMTGEKAITIHSLLGLKVHNNFETGKVTLKQSNNSQVVENSLIIIDEASMCDENLLQVIRDLTFNCMVLYIGDSYQLAPVFKNNCPVFEQVDNQVYLTTIQRQAADSPIIQFASKFRDAQDTGIFPVIESQGTAIQHMTKTEFQAEVDQKFTDPSNSIDTARIVTWSNPKVRAYNKYVRGLHTASEAFEVGEYVTVNEAIIMNEKVLFRTDSINKVTRVTEGEQHGIDGWHISLDYSPNVFMAREQFRVKLILDELRKHKKWRLFFSIKESFVDLRSIFANTVHKSQGSTYETVYIDLKDIGRNTKNYEIARLMYVAITRASDRVVLYGELPKRLY